MTEGWHQVKRISNHLGVAQDIKYAIDNCTRDSWATGGDTNEDLASTLQELINHLQKDIEYLHELPSQASMDTPEDDDE